MHPCEKGWPIFNTSAELAASPWGAYFTDLYGALPPADQFPLAISDFWMLYDSLLQKHSVPLPPSAGQCAPAHCSLNLYTENNGYSPPSQWVWHPPPVDAAQHYQPYADFPPNTWIEVMHEQDPFGDEHNGAWYLFAKGSGVWFLRAARVRTRNLPIPRVTLLRRVTVRPSLAARARASRSRSTRTPSRTSACGTTRRCAAPPQPRVTTRFSSPRTTTTRITRATRTAGTRAASESRTRNLEPAAAAD
jgi:hypothetical protein